MKKTILTAILCAFIATPAMACHHNKGDSSHKHKDDVKCEKCTHSSKTSKMMKKMDKNGDNMISIDEHEAYHGKKFFDTDANGDRMLSATEIMNNMAQKKDEWKRTEQSRGYNN